MAHQLNDLFSKLSHGKQELKVQPYNQENLHFKGWINCIHDSIHPLWRKKKEINAKWILLCTTIPSHHQQIHWQERKTTYIEKISTFKCRTSFYSLAVFAWINKLLNEFVEVPAMITNAIRVRKQSDGLVPTKVIVSSVKEKSYFLCDHRNLHNKLYLTHASKVFITQDLTPMQ